MLVHPRPIVLAVLAGAAAAQEFAGWNSPFFGPAPASVVIADLDGDGDLDAAAGNVLFGRLELHWNDGEGVFRIGAVYPIPGFGGSASITHLAVADVDGDGDVDVIAAVGRASPCGFPDQLLRNLGNGAFVLGSLTGVADPTVQLLPFDVDNDGDQDVLQVNSHSGVFCSPFSTRVLQNNGAGLFADVTATWMPAAPFLARSAAVLDVQGDGWLDVVFDSGAVFVNNGVQLAVAPVGLPLALADVHAADLDADGDDDLYGIANATVVALRNTGGTFTTIAGPALPLAATRALAGDVDGDGDLDLWITTGASPQPPAARLWRQDAGMTFTDVTATQVPALPSTTFNAAFVDGDGDGDQDLLVPQYGVLHNDGTGRFVDLGSSPTPRRGRATDVDGDGHTDVVATLFTTSTSSIIAWWRNRGDGEFELAGTVLSGSFPHETWIVPLDVDGDGDQDVFTGRAGFPPERLARNDGAGVFTDVTAAALPPPPLPPNNKSVRKPVAGDFDGDGDGDLFLARGAQWPTSAQDSLLLNNGVGVFTDVGPTHFVDGEETTDAVALDFDGDGDLDLAVLAAGQPFRLFANDGTAHFTDVTAAHVPSVPAANLLAVDVDGDLDPDLVVRSTTTRLLRNDNGTFVDASAQLAPHAAANHPLATDVDDDGDLDLLLGGEWQLNDGSGMFAASGAPPMYFDELADEHLLADVDGDGDPDVLGALRNRHRQLENTIPPRLGLHGELWLYARSTAPGWSPAGLLLLGQLAPTPVAVGSLGSLRLDPSMSWLHSASTVPPGGRAVVRYLCPNTAALLGSTTWAQPLVLHGPAFAEWRLGNAIALRVLL